MKNRRWNVAALVCLLAGLCASAQPCCAFDESAEQGQDANSGFYVKVQLEHPVKMSKLKPGDVVEGTLARDVYSGNRDLFPAGSQVRLTVDRIEERRRAANDHWPWAVKAFTPRHEKYPVFSTAAISGTGGESALQVTLISVSRKREVQAKPKPETPSEQKGTASENEGSRTSGGAGTMRAQAPTMVLEAFGVPETRITSSDTDASAPSAGSATLPAGTRCRILLLGDISASKSKPGDAVQARLLEPVRLDSRVILPAGSVFQGRVLKRTPPRWLSRAGSLYLTFTELTLPGGIRLSVAGSLAGAELDRNSHTRIDAEGQLHGEHPGKAWMAINLGVTAGLGKVADDGLQLVIEAVVSTATDVSTAGAGRIAAGCVAGIFLITRHGRDVVLPRFTEMDIALDRPLSTNSAVDAGRFDPK